MTSMSTITVTEVTKRGQFDAVNDIQWIAMHDPFRPEFPWMHPIHGDTEADRQKSIKADTDRRWKSHIGNSASHWLYATDTATGEIVGAIEWQVYTKNPFPDGPVALKCDWFPEGETREFVELLINQCYYARMNWMDRPHISLNGMAVLPSARGRGVGSAMMKWGLQKAEELDLECFLEASDPGRDLYEHYDFQLIMTFAANMHRKNSSQNWIRMQNQYGLVTATLMWRPKPSDIRSGRTMSFWDMLKRMG